MGIGCAWTLLYPDTPPTAIMAETAAETKDFFMKNS
jgi:hypothetical protein